MYYHRYTTPLGDIYICQEQGAIVRITPYFAPQPTDCEQECAIIKACFTELSAYLMGESQTFSVPLKPQGTAFQQRVWAALQQIPYGETRTYADVAHAVGCNKGYQAVGAACRANPILFAIPCHRVVGRGGKLTGFAGGLAMKAYLLHLEQRQ